MDGGIFFFCSFKVGERMLYFILFGIYGGSKRDWVFLVEAFSKLEIIRLGIFFFFFSEDFIFICIALDILMKSDHRRIDIMFVSVWIFMSFINFFLFLPFLFSSFLFYWFIRFINVIYPRSMFNWICKICLFFVTEARHIDKLLHQFHKCKGNKFEK